MFSTLFFDILAQSLPREKDEEDPHPRPASFLSVSHKQLIGESKHSGLNVRLEVEFSHALLNNKEMRQ